MGYTSAECSCNVTSKMLNGVNSPASCTHANSAMQKEKNIAWFANFLLAKESHSCDLENAKLKTFIPDLIHLLGYFKDWLSPQFNTDYPLYPSPGNCLCVIYRSYTPLSMPGWCPSSPNCIVPITISRRGRRTVTYYVIKSSGGRGYELGKGKYHLSKWNWVEQGFDSRLNNNNDFIRSKIEIQIKLHLNNTDKYSSENKPNPNFLSLSFQMTNWIKSSDQMKSLFEIVWWEWIEYSERITRIVIHMFSEGWLKIVKCFKSDKTK